MHLYIYFKDEHIEHHIITRFSDISQTKSKFYYYEEHHHEYGKGICFKREDIICFEVSLSRIPEYEKDLKK